MAKRKSTTTTTNGGARPGAGRKRLAESIPGIPPGEPTVTWTIRLPACVVEGIDRTEARAALVRLWRRRGGDIS